MCPLRFGGGLVEHGRLPKATECTRSPTGRVTQGCHLSAKEDPVLFQNLIPEPESPGDLEIGRICKYQGVKAPTQPDTPPACPE